MPKQKIKAIIRKFLFIADPDDTKETVKEMYDILMLSEEEISPEQRQRFTLTCQSVESLMDDLNTIKKKFFRFV